MENKKIPIYQLFRELSSSDRGLTTEEAKRRQKQYGLNAIEEKKESLIVKALSYFWGPIAWMIEAAAILSFIIHHYADFVIIMFLLIFNAALAFWQEYQAGNAIEALKKKLALRSAVLRNGTWEEIEAHELVPGDIIEVRIGDIIPADAVLFDGGYLSIDQSVLTGESLPVDKGISDTIYSGSIVQKGAMKALVTAIGNETYFGHTAKLVATSQPVSHFQKAVIRIGDFLIYICLALVTILILVQVSRHDSLVGLLKFSLILIVASIPVAMPAVLSVTMAIGALALSKMKCIVARLDSLEEMAGVDTLCCDKTGTLTYNKLVMGSPVIFNSVTEDELIATAAMASESNNLDSIERTIVENVHNHQETLPYKQIHFLPFDPVIKRSEATIQGSEGVFKVMKGAPQVVLSLCEKDKQTEADVNRSIEEFAKRGYRTLGVARTDAKGGWEFLGLIPFFDKVRDDSKQTVFQAEEHGIDVKMLTGDHQAIAREVAREVGIGERMFNAQEFSEMTTTKKLLDIGSIVEKVDCFSQVFPESKHLIVRALQSQGHIVGMTGDGVNDAPALKQANLGIAVSGAADAARAAASLVLTAPGLAVIIKGIGEARRIFERMTTYSIYRIAETIRVMFFMVFSILAYNFYPVTAMMLILLALLNDIPIMTIAYDRAPLPPKPVRWQMHKVLAIASLLGGIGVISSFVLLILANSWFEVGLEKLQSIIFLKLSLAGHQTLFLARSRLAFWSKPYPAPILLGSILGTQVITALLVGFGILLPQIPWSYVGYIWVYAIGWMFIADRVKIWGYSHINGTSSDLLASSWN